MNTNRVRIYLLSILLILAIGGCERIERVNHTNEIGISPTILSPTSAPTKAPTPTPTIAPTLTPTPVPTLTPAVPTGVQRIDPYNYEWYNADLKKLLDETLNGRKLEALQGNERLNAELYTYWLSYYIPGSQPSPQPTAMTDYYDLGEEVLTDIDSDGKAEKIKVEEAQDSSDNYLDLVKLTIDNQSVELQLDNALDTFAIADVDTQDKYKQIIIGENGPSDDPFSKIFTYDGQKIIDCGGLVGTISPDHQGIRIDGSGTICTMERTDVLQTWHYQAVYSFDETLHFTEVLPAKGYYETWYPVVVLKPIIVYENCDVSSRQLNISEAQSAQLIGINKQWVLINAADGTQGWILTDSDHYYNVLNGNASVPSKDLLYFMGFYD